MALTTEISRNNYYAFLWHATFLALARNFMDVDTVIPAMLVEAGGEAVHIGFITAIMLGGSSFTQLFFAPYLSNKSYKKPSLLWGINTRIASLLGLGLLMFFSGSLGPVFTIWLIFLLIAMFSLGGAFAGICYTDMLGKSILEDTRKPFFSLRQIITGVGAFTSAVLVKLVLEAWGYPVNYALMLFIGFFALFVASWGFWRIEEVLPSGMVIADLRQFREVAVRELRTNPRLKYFLGYVNTQGISIALLPFVIVYANHRFGTNAGDAGSFLLFKVAGSVLVSILVFVFARRIKYRYLLYSTTVLALAIPPVVLLAGGKTMLFAVFLAGGAVFSLYTIAMNGVLLELSENYNRTLYTGIAGAGNLIPALFPVLGGWVIQQFGFGLFFGLFMAVVGGSFYFIYRLNCLR